MIIRTTEDFIKFSNWIKNQDILAFDIETTGLNGRQDKIIGFGISNLDNESFYIPHLQFVNCKLEVINTKETCIDILEELKKKKLITWNGAFDIPFTKHYFGIDLLDSLWCDALLAKHTVDEIPPFKLKQVGKKLYGADATKEQEEMAASVKANGGIFPAEMYKCDLDIMAKYCMQDCKLTSRIAQYYLAKIEEEGLTAFFFEDEVMPLYKEVTIPMEQGGIPVDVPLLESSLVEINKDISMLEDSIQDNIAEDLDNFMTWYVNRHYPPKNTGAFAQEVAAYYKLPLPKLKSKKYSMAAKSLKALIDCPAKSFLVEKKALHPRVTRIIQTQLVEKEEEKYAFNLSSKHHLKKLFFERLGEKAVSFTDLGNPQVDDAFLDLMADKYDWVKDLQNYNKLIKLRGAYIERFLEKQENGIFYPSFFQHRTISGRYGSDIQQLPRILEEEEADPIVLKYRNLVRKFFISGENHVFIDADYESLEPHVFAHVSGDDGLRDIFRRGDDFYSTIAIQTEGLGEFSADKKAPNYLGECDKPRRQKAKAYSLGIPYGMTDYKLQFEIGVTQADAARLIKQYLDAFPELANWMEDSNRQAIENGFVQSEAGRIRHLPEAKLIAAKHGVGILNSLQLWKDHNEHPKRYKEMKELRKRLSNNLNNAKNYQIQSLATSIVNRAAIMINRYMKEEQIPGYVCAQIHDQLVVRVEERHSKIMKSVVQDIMENNYKLSVDLKSPALIGRTFADAH